MLSEEQIGSSVVNIYFFDISETLTTHTKYEREKILSNYELKLQEEFYTKASRDQYVATRLALRKVLTSHFPFVKESEWTFKNNQYGRPYVNNHILKFLVYFSISHSHDLVMISISKLERLAIDIEYTLRDICTSELEEYVVSKMEKEVLNKQCINNKTSLFFEFWTLRESYLKAISTGFHSNSSDLSFIPNGQEIFVYKNSNKLKKFSFDFKIFTILEYYTLSVCFSRSAIKAIVIIDGNTIIKKNVTN